MSNESASSEIIDITPSEIAGPETVANILPSPVASLERVAGISPSQVAAPERVADISPSQVAALERVADISPSQVAAPERVADISASEVASPEIAIHISKSSLFDRTISEQDRHEGRVDLLSAALDGDWEEVIKIVTYDPYWLDEGITERGDSILHMAVIDSKVKVVEALIGIDPSGLRYTNKDGDTAFFIAAARGQVKIVEMMMQQDEELPHIRGANRMTPLHKAVINDRRDMVNYLLEVTDDKRLYNTDRIEILIWSITRDSFDVALHVLENHLELALMRDSSGLTALHALARRPLKIADGHQPSIWEILSGRFTTEHDHEPKPVLELTKMLWCQIVEQSTEYILAAITDPWPLLPFAVGLGKVEFLTVLIQYYPPILSNLKDEYGYSIIHHAVIHRQPEIFRLIYTEEYMRNKIVVWKDKKQNNMLHLAGKLAPRSNVSGAALRMQRELQWFQAVKKCIRYDYIEAQNADNETPQDLFTKEHEELRKQGEEWMKKTAESCALVAALITTMVFSAAFQLPGGLNDTGSPVLVKNTSFVFFAMSNAVSLFTSTSSILVFLSILTSRYAERDFLRSLPVKLMIGLILLLISIATMVVGFTVTFFIIFQEGLRWPPIVIGILASVPVILFAFQQFPLLAEMYYSTYKFTNALLPGHQRVFKGTSTQLFAYYGRTLADLNKIRGHIRDKSDNHDD